MKELEAVDPLSESEVKRFRSAEAVISKNRLTWDETVKALCDIHSGKLYREAFSNFGDYVVQRWGFGRRWAETIISGEIAIREIEDAHDDRTDPVSVNTEQLRASSAGAKAELAKIEKPKTREKVAEKALEKSNGEPPTKKQVIEAASEVMHKPKPNGAKLPYTARASGRIIEELPLSQGMSLRDHFARTTFTDTEWDALITFATFKYPEEVSFSSARLRYIHADAMLAERSKEWK